MNLDNPLNIIDWTHEREWRVPNEIKFDYRDIEIILPTEEIKKQFVELCEITNRQNMLKDIKGMVILPM